MVEDKVGSQYRILSYSVTVSLAAGEAYPDPATGINIGFLGLNNELAVVNITRISHEAINEIVRPGDTLDIGEVRNLHYIAQFGNFDSPTSPKVIQVTLRSL